MIINFNHVSIFKNRKIYAGILTHRYFHMHERTTIYARTVKTLKCLQLKNRQDKVDLLGITENYINMQHEKLCFWMTVRAPVCLTHNPVRACIRLKNTRLPQLPPNVNNFQ